MIIVDSAGLLAYLDASEGRHAEVKHFLLGRDDSLLLSPFVLAELNYFLRKRGRPDVALTLLRDIEEGAYDFVLFTGDDITEAREVIEKYAAHDISLADASLVVLARRFSCFDILSYDNHFRVMQPGGPMTCFRLVPLDL